MRVETARRSIVDNFAETSSSINGIASEGRVNGNRGNGRDRTPQRERSPSSDNSRRAYQSTTRSIIRHIQHRSIVQRNRRALHGFQHHGSQTKRRGHHGNYASSVNTRSSTPRTRGFPGVFPTECTRSEGSHHGHVFHGGLRSPRSSGRRPHHVTRTHGHPHPKDLTSVSVSSETRVGQGQGRRTYHRN